MKRKIRKSFYSKALAAAVGAAVLVQAQAPVLANALEDGPLYISEVYLSYGDTDEKAKKWLEDNGYEILDQNLNEDAEGGVSWLGLASKKRSVYLGYKTTDDPDEAITDMRAMNMRGDYSYNEYEKIKRIAEEISYIDAPAGDIPNVQIDGYRTASSEGIPITDGMKISFHAKSLPTARLVWHCPYVDIFTSDDGKVGRASYTDHSFMRIDGECWQNDDVCKADLVVNKNDDFAGWDYWKKLNRDGIDCTVTFEKKGNTVTVNTENGGILIKVRTELFSDDGKTVYAALTGDQCAITNIRIINKD
ncbi:MAG: hypothetical protein IKO27_03705 [Ruminococcus sp.]|nr:hypothetical protein [Ruminococcus sp.]